MKSQKWIIALLRFICISGVVIFGLASVIATGGGGSNDGASSSSSGLGSVALSVADGPADDYDHIWIWISQVMLLPPDNSEKDPVVVFQSDSPQGCMIDLLAYRDEDFLLTLKSNVPAGRYDKIRLKVENIVSEGGPCDLEMIKLPSGKIDLNPRGGISVASAQTLSIRLDIDANKSINLHPTGNPDKCLFRPVVFVDIEPVGSRPQCPKLLRGTIADLIDENDDSIIEGFVLRLGQGRGSLTVYLMEEVVIFDGNGLPASSEALDIGQAVRVRGTMDPDGSFQASLVVIGEVLDVKGEAEGPVDPEGLFSLSLDPDQEIVGESVDVRVSDDTLILIGCDNQVDSSAIQEGMPTRVFGKYQLDDEELRAMIILLRPREIIGQVLSVTVVAMGRSVIVQTGEGQDITVWIPTGTPIYLEGDGEVPVDLLCLGREVRVVVDPDRPASPVAMEVWLKADTLEGTVTATGPDRTLFIDGVSTYVPLSATILDTRGDNDVLMSFEDILNHTGPSFELKCFGLEPCPGESAFTAFVVLVVGPES